MRRKIILAVFLFGSFFIFNFVLAATSTVVINEIGAYPSSTHEWVEIFNASDNLIDLSNWKFWENNTNHGLKIVSTSDMFLSSKDYAIIAQNRDVFLQDYPSFSGKVFGSSWVNLSESGEEIGLKSSDGNFVEKFIYLPAVSFSLERKDPFLLDYSSNNWQENNSSNTAGMQNFNYFVDETVSSSSILIDTSINTTTNTTTNFSTSSDVTLDSLVTSSTTSTIELSTTSPDWSLVKLNEIVSDPVSGNEMVEIFNNSSTTIDLNGGEICDTTGSECKILSGVVLGHDWLVADLFTDRYLNNTGDGVVLKDSQNNIIDMVAYGTSTLPSPDKSQSLIRKEDGADTDTDIDWVITNKITLGIKNELVLPPSPLSAGSSNSVSGGTNSTVMANPMSSTPKVIKITTKPVTTTIKDSVKISWKLDYPYGIAVGEAGIFSAKGTADPRGGDIGLVWDFGDHTTSSGPIVNHIFTTSGIYSVSVLATSTAGTSGEKNFKVYVGEEFAYSASSVKIGNFLVDGDDIDEQFIELINWSNQVKNISGWKIKNNHGKEFEIPENTMMPPSSSRKFFRSITHLGFDKDNDRIIFSTPSDKVVDNVLLDTDKPVMEKIETSKPKTVFNWRRIKGIVSVAPGVFAQQYFYVFDGEHGYQIYQYKKDFPPLQTGDEIAVSGEAIKTDNIERLKISGRKDIDILSTGQEIVPIEISLAELDDDLNGAIVKITGDITSLKNNLLYLDDGNDEIVVYFRPTVKIEKTDLRVGDKLEVIGVLEKSKNDWRISPRSQGDLRLVSDGSESLSGGKGDEADQKNSTTKKYVSVTAGGLFSLLFGLAVKNRGLMLVSVSRKIASTVVKIIRRG